MLSYEVEQFWYDKVAPRLGPGVAVAQCLASTRRFGDRAVADSIAHLYATVMTDLRVDFPVAGQPQSSLTPAQVAAALVWLGRFHGSSWRWLPPLDEAQRRRAPGPARQGLWLNGRYTYLATRRNEYAALAADEASEWSAAFCRPMPDAASAASVAELVAAFLTPCGLRFETFVHGDVKSENLFSTASGDAVAFFDFQYVGIGLGVSDLAKLMTCSVPVAMLTGGHAVTAELDMGTGERALLDQYRTVLLNQPSSTIYDWDDFCRHWETALVDWCRFQASWGFWGNTDWLQARVRRILGDSGWRNWLCLQLEDG